MPPMTMRQLSPGEKAVGLTFNPGGNAEVNDIKKDFAMAIDRLIALKQQEEEKPLDKKSSEKIRMYSIAITEAQTAQMWAVKAVTWQY